MIESRNVLDLLLELGFIQSKGEGKRLVQGGGIKFEGEKITDMAYTFEKDGVLQSGKRNFIKVKVK